MTITIAAATARIQRTLPDAEISIDGALLASTRLMESILLARGAEGVPVYSAQTALMRLAKSQRSLIEAEADMIRVHADLLKTGREVGSADQPGDCPPPSGLLDETVATLRAA